MTSKALLCIGASRLQLPTLRWAREAGLFVVATDRRPNAPGREIADRFEAIDGCDVAALVALAQELQRERGLAGAWASNDFGLEAVAQIGAATDTPSNRAHAVRLSLDKDATTRLWRERGVPTSVGRLVRNPTELHLAWKELGKSVVIKPTGASGSMGVRIAQTKAKALRAFETALAASGEIKGGGVLVEKRLEGRHLDVNGFFREGVFHAAGLLDRHFSDTPYCVPLWGAQPARIEAQEEHAVYDLVERGARALGLEVGPIKADVVLTAEGPTLLELAPRFHGDVSTAFVSPLAYGKSPIQAWIAHLANAGGPFDEMPHRRPMQVGGWMAILPEQPGVLRAVHGLDQARAAPGIAEVMVLKPEGYTIETLGDNRAVCGFLWAAGESHARVEERLRHAHALVRVEMEVVCPSVA